MDATAGADAGPPGQTAGAGGAPLVLIRHVSKGYRRGAQTVEVLIDVNLSIAPGDFVALMGPSGSGKSTLLNLIAGIDKPDGGELRVAQEDITRLGESALAAWRARSVGFVFQFYNLMPVLTALENVELPLLLTDLSGSQRRARAELMLELVGLSDRLDHYPNELSGGQQQRVAIARALVTDPLLIIADEPTGDLDRASAAEILKLLDRLNVELGKTIVMVTHDPRAAEAAHHLIYLDKGQLTDTAPGLNAALTPALTPGPSPAARERGDLDAPAAARERGDAGPTSAHGTGTGGSPLHAERGEGQG